MSPDSAQGITDHPHLSLQDRRAAGVAVGSLHQLGEEAVQVFGAMRREGGWRWLALAMIPALVSAMAACTWHLFDNSAALKGLVVFQAALTAIGNTTMAIACWNLLRQQRLRQQQP